MKIFIKYTYILANTYRHRYIRTITFSSDTLNCPMFQSVPIAACAYIKYSVFKKTLCLHDLSLKV